MHSLSAKTGCSWSSLNEMKGSSGQAMVPASICPFPHTTFFNDSVCRHQDRPNGDLYLVTGSVAVAMALGCGKALGVTASTAECQSSVHCRMLCSTGSKTHPLTHWGQAPWWSQCQSSPTSSQHPQNSSSNRGSAGCEQGYILVFHFLCWPEVWPSWFTHRPGGIESTKLWYITTTGD